MSWRTWHIGELVESGNADIQTGPFGTQLKASDYIHDGTPVINVRNIGYADLRTEKLEFVGDQVADRLSVHLLQENDIVFGRKGAVDRHLLVTSEQVNWMQGSDCIRLRFKTEEVLPRFVSYAFLRNEHQQWMLTQSGNKATMASLNQDIIKRIPLTLPPRVVQVEIAKALGAYDDLIENNRRRMALLEESARLLYREWFVRLRFPGHEHTRITDGVPEGWERKSLASVCSSGDGIQTGPFGSQLHQADYSDEGVPVVMPKDLVDFRISVTSIARIPEALADSLGRHRMAPGDIVYGRRGDIGRRAYIGKRQAGWFCGTGCLRFRPNPLAINPLYLFDTLGAPDTLGTIMNRAKGSTMPNLSASALKSVPLLVASRRLQDIYVEQVESMREALDVLDEQNQKLRAARDLLLPRLMSGEIAV